MTDDCIAKTGVVSRLLRCKDLSRIIKAKRIPPWPVPRPTQDLPDKAVADELVKAYLRTFESVYRILHLPTFQQKYERVWGSGSKRDASFLVQLKLVFAIGAVVRDDTFSMRTSAMRWIYEALAWATKPVSKSRLNIACLQTSLLLLIAREVVGVDKDSISVSAGALLRTAMHMGLHRDPKFLPKTSLYEAEMRRRLWNTILEVMLQSSMSLGAPPLISLGDFDSEPPANYEDDQITCHDEGAAARPEYEFTQISTAIALRRTLPARIAVVRCLNQLGLQTSYPESLGVDRELKAAYRELCQTLRSSAATSPFALRFVDYIMHRYMMSLHVPFLDPGLGDATYAYSRKTAVDAALKAWSAACPSTSIMTSTDDEAVVSARDDLSRLISCGTGFFRSTAKIAALVATAELQATIMEESGLIDHHQSSTLARELMCIVEKATHWAIRCMHAGDVNARGPLLQAILATHVNFLIQKGGEDKLSALLIQAAEETSMACLSVLEETVGEKDKMRQQEMCSNTPADRAQSWAFLVISEAL